MHGRCAKISPILANSDKYDFMEAMSIGPPNYDGPIIENALIILANVERNQGRSGAGRGWEEIRWTHHL